VPTKQVRVQKARVSTTVSCGHLVRVGQQEVKARGGTWVCIKCAIDRRLIDRDAAEPDVAPAVAP
jgi:hypothetical protein